MNLTGFQLTESVERPLCDSWSSYWNGCFALGRYLPVTSKHFLFSLTVTVELSVYTANVTSWHRVPDMV